jgi:hypothetical protein
MNVCAKICKECPFSNQSLKGWLADYKDDDIIAIMRDEVSFPCHKLVNSDMTDLQADKLIKSGELKLCRGYVESIIKSAKSPFMNVELIKAIQYVRESGLSENSMPIWEFKKYHEKN